jgi:hypothetical protein
LDWVFMAYFRVSGKERLMTLYSDPQYSSCPARTTPPSPTRSSAPLANAAPPGSPELQLGIFHNHVQHPFRHNPLSLENHLKPRRFPHRSPHINPSFSPINPQNPAYDPAQRDIRNPAPGRQHRYAVNPPILPIKSHINPSPSPFPVAIVCVIPNTIRTRALRPIIKPPRIVLRNFTIIRGVIKMQHPIGRRECK